MLSAGTPTIDVSKQNETFEWLLVLAGGKRAKPKARPRAVLKKPAGRWTSGASPYDIERQWVVEGGLATAGDFKIHVME